MRTLRICLFLLTPLAILTTVVSSAAAQSPDATPPPPDTRQVPPGLLTATQVTKSPKLDSALARLAAAAQVSATAMTDVAEAQSLRLVDHRVQVQIVTHAAGLSQVENVVTAVGGAVTGAGFGDTVIQAWLPVTALEIVVAQSDVYFIRRPSLAYPLENLYVGQATTEALQAINASAWHGAGFNGTGVKVAIIDAGFLGYAGLLGVDLPGAVTVKNFVDGENDSQVDGLTEHGTACAEIIHDLAPEAQLYLVKIATDVDLAEAVNWLISQDIDIISSSFGFYNVSPGDGSGPLAELVSQAQAAGILWVTAAGNDRETHWGGLYADVDGNNVHEFDGEEVNCFAGTILGEPTCDGLSFWLVLSLVGQVNIFVRWNDWTHVNQDYDLHLVRWNGAEWEVVAGASSTNPQTGAPGQTPTEWINYTPSGDNDDLGSLLNPYGFIIERVQGNRPVNFEVFTPALGGILRPDKIVRPRSLANLADAPDAITVAALDVNQPYPQEFYSSEGPTNGPGGAAVGGFTKPDLAGFANVSTQSYGTGLTKFNGTSAATPHVAGAAAVVLSAYPGYRPVQLRTFLAERAVDMGSPGPDTRFGHGRLNLGAAPAGINTPPTLAKLPDQTISINSSLDNAIDLWAYANDAQDTAAALDFTINNTPIISAGVTIEANRFVDITPSSGWVGSATIEILVKDTGGLTATSDFDLAVIAGNEPDHFIYLPALLKTEP